MERCPQARKTLHRNGCLKEKRARKSFTSSSLEKRGPTPWNLRVRKGTDAGPLGPLPGESCQEMETPAEHQRKASERPSKEAGKSSSARRVGAGRARIANEGTRRDAGLGVSWAWGSSGPAAGSSLTSSWSQTWPFSRGLTHQLMVPNLARPPGSSVANSVLGDHFRIQPVSRK